MFRNAIWFYEKSQDGTARAKMKLILLWLCFSSLFWERGRYTYSSLSYFALHIRIKYFKYFRIQPVQPHAALSTRHSTGTEEATLGGRHTWVTSTTQQSTCHGHPCDTTGTETGTRTRPLTQGEAEPCQGISQVLRTILLKNNAGDRALRRYEAGWTLLG